MAFRVARDASFTKPIYFAHLITKALSTFQGRRLRTDADDWEGRTYTFEEGQW